ncbi:iron chaperone [Gordonia sp. NPDC003424]
MGTIDDYLDQLDPDDRTEIDRVYTIARKLVPDVEQGKGYGMPALIYHGKPLLSVMRAKKHFGVYPFGQDPVAAAAPMLDGFEHAKGTVRFPPGKPLPDDAIRALVTARRDQIDTAGRG